MPVEGQGPGEAGIHLGLGPRGQDWEPAPPPGHPAGDVPSWGEWEKPLGLHPQWSAESPVSLGVRGRR